MVCPVCIAAPVAIAAVGVTGSSKLFKKYKIPLIITGSILSLISIYFICIFIIKKVKEKKKKDEENK